MIAANKVVGLIYTLKDDAGKLLDEAPKNDLFFYLHGEGQIVPGLEDALEGLKPGDKKAITVTPDQGYGQLNEEMKVVVSRDQFPKEADVQPGMQFLAEMGKGGKHPFTVIDVKDGQVHLDGNHPLAGQTLHFDVEVVEVRDATKEELEHGHAHGPHSHH